MNIILQVLNNLYNQEKKNHSSDLCKEDELDL